MATVTEEAIADGTATAATTTDGTSDAATGGITITEVG